MHIGILGIGGVGGYFGGKLAAHYRDSTSVAITFIGRLQTAAVVREQGIILRTANREQTIHPVNVVSSVEGLESFDVLICATKSYDLETALKPLQSCVTSDTLILPLLNGVNAGDTIARMFPQAQLAEGCVYINAKRASPGVIEKTGDIEELYFGGRNLPQEKLETLQQMFRKAGIESYLSSQIETDTWTKFVMISGMATATSYFNESIGHVLQTPDHCEDLQSLMTETHAVALAKGIALPGDLVAATMAKLRTFPFEATSSMHRDFMSGGQTEYRSLTDYVAELGQRLGVATSTFDRMLPELAARERVAIS